jgi:aryl-alcohol dehydrogenase-like predicted oxidoreductase
MTQYRRKTRRTFLANTFTTALTIAGCSSFKLQGETSSLLASNESAPTSTSSDINESLTTSAALLRRQLGRIDVQLPVLGLGGAGNTPLSRTDGEKAALEQIQRALELGIRYFDTAASYGSSESYLGKVLPTYRKEIFLSSKTAARDRDGAWRDLEASLRRLNTPYLDLWQFHHVSFESELETLFGPNGAVRALEEAKSQGLVRYSGITGHHEPDIIVAGLRRYPFDHTLVPINAADVHHPRPFISRVLPVARSQNVGVTAMKVPAYGRLFQPGGLTGMPQALSYTLSQAGVHCAVIAAETTAQLEENVRAATSFLPLDASGLAEIERRTVSLWQDATFFRAWT